MTFLSVLKFLGILLEVLLIFNLLIIVHELGHFLAAKWRGLVIERFGIWFGKPIWEKKIGGVWYSLGSIPAGGFVKLPQLAPMEALEGETEINKEELKPISPLDKIIVAFAGPLFSFLLACVMAVIVWQVGRPVSEGEGTTIVGYVMKDSPAEKAGLQVGDKILSIDGHKVSRWGGQSDDSVTWRIARSEEAKIKLELDRGGAKVDVEAEPKIEDTKWFQRRGLRQLGLIPKNRPMIAQVKAGSAAAQAGFLANDLITHVGGKEVFEAGTMSDWAEAHPGEPMVVTVDRAGTTAEVTFSPKGVLVESVMPDGPAATAGLKAGDRILSADGKPIAVSSVLIKEINSAVDRAVALEIEREGAKQQVTVKPRLPVTDLEGEKPKPSIGVVLVGLEASHGITFDMYGKLTPIYPTPTEQVKAGVSSIVNTVDAVTSRKSSISVQHMGGPVMMMRIYYLLFQSPEGWRMALWFSVVLNINLALLNMLPLPVLDGGHIVLAIVEGVRRKPVNIRVLEYVQTGCALLIIGFMIFVTFFDIQDVFGGGSKKKGFHFEKAPAEAPK